MNYNSGGNRASNFKSAERVESHDQYWDIFLNVNTRISLHHQLTASKEKHRLQLWVKSAGVLRYGA